MNIYRILFETKDNNIMCGFVRAATKEVALSFGKKLYQNFEKNGETFTIKRISKKDFEEYQRTNIMKG